MMLIIGLRTDNINYLEPIDCQCRIVISITDISNIPQKHVSITTRWMVGWLVVDLTDWLQTELTQ